LFDCNGFSQEERNLLGIKAFSPSKNRPPRLASRQGDG